MKSAIVTIGCIGLFFGFLAYWGVRIRREERQNELHRQQLAEELRRHKDRVKYGFEPRRKPSYYVCEQIWNATLAQEREWRRLG